MKVNELLKNKLVEGQPNYVHADNNVKEEYWSPEGWVAFRDELGLLWLDNSALDEAFASDDDEHPSDEKPLLLNESHNVWIGLTDERGEWYRLVNEDGKEAFVLVSHSIQHTPYERELTVIGEVPAGNWTVAEPTPYSPRAILR